MKERISASSFLVSSKTEVAFNGSLFLVAKEAPSIITPGTSVIGSGDNIKANPVFRSVFEMELGFATCLSLSLVPTSARCPATCTRSFMRRVAELALDLTS